MKIKMIQHYCGYQNNNTDWWPEQQYTTPDDLSEESARDLVERKYAVEVIEPRAAVAIEEMTKAKRK